VGFIEVITKDMDKNRYKTEFLAEMHRITKYFDELEKNKWKKQKINYKTYAAYAAEKEFIKAQKER
jgi:hypothetical protein